MRRLGCWLAVGLGLGLAAAAQAATDEYVKAQVDRNAVNLGDPLVYTVEVMTAGEQQSSPDITPPDLSGRFQLQDTFSRSSVSILNGKTHIVTFKELHLVASRTGQVSIPPSQVEVTDPATGAKVRRESNSVTVWVREAAGAAALATPTPEIEVLRPIKPGAHVSLSQWLPFAAAGFGLLAMLGTMAWLRRRPEEPPPPPAPSDPRTPEQRALDLLNEIETLRQAGRLKEYFTFLSRIVRRYLGEAFAFKAEESTSDELLREMLRLEFKPEFLAQLRPFLQACDRIKFANVQPEPAAAAEALARARALVQVAEKRIPPPPPPAAVPAAPGPGQAAKPA
jgi:hypothetical protein